MNGDLSRSGQADNGFLERQAQIVGRRQRVRNVDLAGQWNHAQPQRAIRVHARTGVLHRQFVFIGTGQQGIRRRDDPHGDGPNRTGLNHPGSRHDLGPGRRDPRRPRHAFRPGIRQNVDLLRRVEWSQLIAGHRPILRRPDPQVVVAILQQPEEIFVKNLSLRIIHGVAQKSQHRGAAAAAPDEGAVFIRKRCDGLGIADRAQRCQPRAPSRIDQIKWIADAIR